MHIIFDVHDQHIHIITELDVKLNKWHITIEKLYRKPTNIFGGIVSAKL